MNDRFKFRAWNRLTRKYIPDIQDRDLVEGGLIDDDKFFDSYLYDNDYVIEQCTGIKDESGNLIYEGDIVKFSFIDEVDFGNFGAKSRVKYIGKGKIIFESGCFVLINLKTNYKIPCFDDKLQFIKILGNVRKNPELLGGVNEHFKFI